MDIVERLRFGSPSYVLIGDAAIEIERLRDQAHYHYENGLKKDVEIERLQEALQLIVRHPAEKTGEYKVGFREVRLVAAKALQQKGE